MLTSRPGPTILYPDSGRASSSALLGLAHLRPLFSHFLHYSLRLLPDDACLSALDLCAAEQEGLRSPRGKRLCRHIMPRCSFHCHCMGLSKGAYPTRCMTSLAGHGPWNPGPHLPAPKSARVRLSETPALVRCHGSQIYILFPLLVWIWMRRGIAPVLCVDAAVLSAAFYSLVYCDFIAMLTPEYVFIFAIGMFAAPRAFRETTPEQAKVRDWKFKVLVALAAIMILRALWLIPGNLSSGPILNILVWRGKRFPVDRRYAQREEASCGAWPTFHPSLGGASPTGLYLLHFPLQQLIWQLFVQPYHLSKLTGFLIVASPAQQQSC